MIRRLVAAWARLILAILEWFHARTVGPIVDWLDESVLAASEESVKLFIRECFTSAKRLINGFCAHLLGMFDAQYRESLKLTWQQKEAWHSWWREERTSTLNAVLAAQAPGRSDATPPARLSSTARQRRTVAFSSVPHVSTSSSRDAAAAAAGRKASGGSFSKGQVGRQPGAHISWQSDTAPNHHDVSSSSSSSNNSSGGYSRSPSPFASDGGAAATAATTEDANTPSSSSSSWLARAVWWALVGLQGRATTPALVTAAATGHSTNPLQTLPSLPSLSSLVSLPSLTTLRSWGSGNAPEPQQQQQQQDPGWQAQYPSSRLGHNAGCGYRLDQQLPQQQQQEEECWQSLLQRLCSSMADKVRCLVTLALLPFVAPILPGLWLLSWLWGRTKSQQQPAAAAAAAAAAPELVDPSLLASQQHSSLRRSSSANSNGSQQGMWGFRRSSSTSSAASALSAAAAEAAKATQQAALGRPPRGQQRSSAAPRRSIVFEEPTALGAQETSRRRGLLEELDVTTELLVTAVFEALRWIVRALTLTRRYHPTAAAMRQRRLAAAAAAVDAANGQPGNSSGSNGGWLSRRSSNGGSSSCRSRPGSPVVGVQGVHSPFAATHTTAAAAAAAGTAEGSDGGDAVGMFRSMSPRMDPGEEAGMQDSIQQQQQQRQYSGSMLSPQASGSSFYSGRSSSSRSSSSGGSESGEDELWGLGEKPSTLLRSKSVGGDLAEFRKGTGSGSSALPRLTLRRVRSVGRWTHHHSGSSGGGSNDSSGGGRGSSSGPVAGGRSSGPWLDDAELTAAAQCIMSAGYPLELHTVTTADGVVLQMERIPRPGCSRVAFFLHGILDTSLTWVSSGVTGSQAFAAWDQGFDVWLGSSRSNAPRIARDPAKQGLGYFSFSLNELGIHDVPAQLDHLHTVKMRELAGNSLRSQGGAAAAAAAAAGLRVDVHELDPWLTSEQQDAPQHVADSEAVFGYAAALSPTAAAALHQQGSASLRPQQQQETGWFSPRSSSSGIKRALSDSNVNLLPGRGQVGGQSPSGPLAGQAGTGRVGPGHEKKRGGMLRAAGRLLRGAVLPSRNNQQQQQQVLAGQPDSQQQQWQTAAAMAAVVSAAAASAAATAAVAAAAAVSNSSSGLSPQQQQQVGRDRFSVAALSSPRGYPILEVNEPSTPELLESPRRPEDGACSAADAAADAVTQLQQQQYGSVQADEDDSPFTAAGEAEAALAAAEAACIIKSGSSGGMCCGSNATGSCGSSDGINGGSSGWHSPRELPCPRLRSTGSYGTAVEGRLYTTQRQQQQLHSPRSVGNSCSAPGAPQQQQPSITGSKSTPGAGPAAAPASAAPYDLRVVAHSLGGLSMLVFCVMRAAAGQPHHVRRLVLLSPAGFHDVIPWAWRPFIFVLPYWHRLLAFMLGKERAYHPALLPTYTARSFFFSTLLELARLPAMADLARALMSGFFGGDASQWERALLMPHYSAAGMPACSLHQALHFIQIINSGRFQLFDYGSPADNMARYGTPTPPDIASQYWRLADNLHVQLMAGTHDGIIPPVNVQRHYQAMQAAGMKVTYREFAYGHMDFTSLAAFSIKDEMRYHVMRALNANN